VCATAVAMSAGIASAQTPPSGAGQGGPPPSSVGGPGTPQTPGAPATMVDTGSKQNDTGKFVEKAAIANMAEIQLGQLAAERAQSAEVKEFAQMMVDEHTKALDELKQAAAAANATVPTALDEKHQKTQAKLSSLNGDAFDREYMKAMVKAHKDAANLLKKEAKEAGAPATSASTAGATGGATGTSGTPTDAASGTTGTSGTSAGAAGSTSSATAQTTGSADVSAWAAQTLPKVQEHLDKAKQIEDALKASAKPADRNPESPTTPTSPTTPNPSAPNPPSTGGAATPPQH